MTKEEILICPKCHEKSLGTLPAECGLPKGEYVFYRHPADDTNLGEFYCLVKASEVGRDVVADISNTVVIKTHYVPKADAFLAECQLDNQKFFVGGKTSRETAHLAVEAIKKRLNLNPLS